MDLDNFEHVVDGMSNMEAVGGNPGFKLRYFQTTC